jgi:hypothetical protein
MGAFFWSSRVENNFHYLNLRVNRVYQASGATNVLANVEANASALAGPLHLCLLVECRFDPSRPSRLSLWSCIPAAHGRAVEST